MDVTLAAKAYRAACDVGDSDGCQSLGWLHLYGIGVARDPALAARMFKTECDRGTNPGACISYDELLLRGIGVKADETAAFTDLEQRCRTTASACSLVGYAVEHGLAGQAKDASRAETIYRAACARAAADGCLFLGKLLVSRGDRGPDAVGALTLACERSRGEACALLADTHPADSREALNARACELGFETRCSTATLRARCEQGSGTACGTAVKSLRTSTARADLELASTLAERGCELRDATSCRGIALLHLGGPNALTTNVEIAVRAYRNACDELLDHDACQSYAWLHLHGIGVPRDHAFAAKEFRRLCDARPTDCTTYYELLMQGTGMKADAATAFAKLDELCTSNPRSCSYTGYAFERGLAGKRKNRAEAERRYRMACSAKSSEGCLLLGKLLVASKRSQEAVAPLQMACDGHRGEACALLVGTAPNVDREALELRACQLGVVARCAKR